MSSWISNTGYLNILSFMIIFCAILTLISILGIIIKYLLNIAFLGWVDRICGAGFSLLKGVLIVSVLLLILTAFLPQGAAVVKRSLLAPHVVLVSEKMAKVVSKDMKHAFNDNLQELKKSLENTAQVKDPTPALKKLMQLIATLRGESGCPWDRKQTPRSMAVYLTEEVFELAAAIESGDRRAVCEELGDVLFQILFIAGLFEESGDFDIEDVARQNTAKMIRRHPHVFGTQTALSTEEVKQNWHTIKQSEKKNSAQDSALDSIPGKLPALLRAYRISERAARTEIRLG